MNTISISIGIVLGLALILMIPISDTVFAKPTFDGTSVGLECSALWDEIKALKDKKANQGGVLNQADSSALGRAESNYKDTCAKWYDGGLPMVNPGLQDSSPSKPTFPEATLDDNILSEQKQQPSKPTFPGTVLNDTMVNKLG